MSTVSQNGILKEEEFNKFKERTVGLRFKQQISYGIGAAMVFGLITALATKLAPMAFGASAVTTASGAVLVPAIAASIPAMIGLGAIAALGVGLIYMSAKYLSENTLLEQDFQAKKIGAAARGVAKEQEPGIVIRPVQFPEQSHTLATSSSPQELKSQPTLVVNNVAHTGRVSEAQHERAHA